MKYLTSMSAVFLFVSSLSFAGNELPESQRVIGTGGTWGMKVHILDVGQADLILVVEPSGDAALIDGGRKKADGIRAARLLKNAQGVTDKGILETMYVTHYDADHIGGIPAFVDEGIAVLNVYDQGPSGKRAISTATGRQSVYGKYVDSINDSNGNGTEDQGESNFIRHEAEFGQMSFLGNNDEVSITILSAKGNTRGEKHDLPLDPSGASSKFDENPGSIALLVKLGDFEFLTAGDQTSDDWKHHPAVEELMLAALPIDGKSNDIDVLKVSHHGSDTSTSDYMANQTRPEVSVISAKYVRNHKLPKLIAIKQLEEVGSYVLVTGNGHNENGMFSESKHSEDDNYTPNPGKVFNKQGDIEIIVSSDGSKYTVYGNSFVKTFSTND